LKGVGLVGREAHICGDQKAVKTWHQQTVEKINKGGSVLRQEEGSKRGEPS